MPDPLGKYTSQRRRVIAKAMWARRTPQERVDIACKIGASHKGKRLTNAQREKLRIAHLGQVAWNKGRKETRPEVIERFRISHLGKKQTKETCEKRNAALRGRVPSEETRRKIGAKHKGKVIPESMREVLRIKCSGWSHSQEAKKSIAAASRRAWADPITRLKMLRGPAAMMKSAGRKPNQIESVVQILLDRSYPGEWTYTGGGSMAKCVGGYYPDFTCERRKKIVEIDGELWHTDARRDRRRNNAYKREGYGVLVIPFNGRLDQDAFLKQVGEFYE